MEADYENSIKVAESGLELARRAETDRGKIFSQYVNPLATFVSCFTK